jgi:hypothetical protein
MQNCKGIAAQEEWYNALTIVKESKNRTAQRIHKERNVKVVLKVSP